MADSKKKKTADEIVEEVASEMGVEDAKVPDSDESAEDVMAGLGGIFDVAKKKKKKKKKPVEEAVVEDDDAEDEDEDEDASDADDSEEDDADDATDDGASDDEAEEDSADIDDEDEEDDEEEEPVAAKKAAPKAKKKSSKKSVDIFNSPDEDVDLSDTHLGPDDLDGFEPSKGGNMPYIIGGVIVLLLAAGALFSVGDKDDIIALFKGELRERRIAKAKADEEAFRQAQLDKLDKFGNLMISGNPQYATLRLDGEIQYGQTSTEEWRELQVTPTTAFQNIKVKEAHKLQVTAPGFEPATLDLTEGMWQESAAGGSYAYQYVANLQPISLETKQEFDARLGTDADNEFYGTITITTTPPGAKVIINNYPLLDKDGVELKTPVTFDRFYTQKVDEKTGKPGKLEEQLVRVDGTIDVGNKIQIQLPPELGADMPKYVTALQRQMWTCTFKDEAELKKMKFDAEKDSIQKKCNYTWNTNLDFNALKSYIERREAEKKRIEEQLKAFNEEMEAKKKELEGK